MAKVKDSWSKPDGIPGLIGRKQVDQSIFTDGTVIPREFYEDFVEANGGYVLPRGEKRDITLLIQGQKYSARLESRLDGPEQWRIIYRASSGVIPVLQERLQVSHNYLQEYRSLTASPERQKLGVISDGAHAEYLAFYSTGTPFRYRVEFITSADRVWAELRETVGEGREVRTLSQGAPNQLTFTDDDIHVTARKEDALPKEWFYSAWQKLIDQKYLTQETMEALAKYRSTAILTILALLPYVEYITAPRVTLFLKTYHYTEEQLQGLLETKDQGAVLFCGKPNSPRAAFFLTDRIREEGDAVIYHGRAGEQLPAEAVDVLKGNAERPYPLYGFKAEYGRFVYFGRYQVGSFFTVELPAFRMVAAGQQVEGEGQRTWIFQANPEKYDVEAAVASLPELHWLVNRHIKEIKPGDTVYLWASGEEAGIVAQTTVLTDPRPVTVSEEERPYFIDGARLEVDSLRVRLRVDHVFERRISRRKLQEHGVLKELTIIRAPFNTNYAVTPEQAEALQVLLSPEQDEEQVHRYVRIGLGEGQIWWPDHINIGWNKVGDLTAYETLDDLVEGFRRTFGPNSYRETVMHRYAAELWAFRWLKPGTTIILTRGEHEVEAVGTVTEAGYRWNENNHTVGVEWQEFVERRMPRMRHWSTVHMAELSEAEFNTIVHDDAPQLSLAEIAGHFGEALEESHIQFGPRHDEVVRSFVAALATKRMAILTGLSGSGKTQIALRFGQWFGEDRYLIVPVRPDWTGPDALLGYEDALQKGPDGRPCWQVPEALAFMFRAAADPYNPYLLVLDEMNLAHVERYFADVLSGMESGEPVLPNLTENATGKWQIKQGDTQAIPFPDNLFVVGTVNVDETTYMFSPKVLDRANTFEFRVETDDLVADLHTPTPCPEGPAALTRGFLALASDPEWHLTQAAPVGDEFVKPLKRVHALLSEGGFEFGHRVFREAIRFATILTSAGSETTKDALDLQIFQKVLPRLHGTHRRLHSTLCALGQFCYELDYQAESVLDGSAPTRFNPMDKSPKAAALPRSFDKIRRMTRSLRANQFTSFTEQ